MIKKILILLLALMLLVPMQSNAGANDESQWWICGQVGTLEKRHVIALSPAFKAESNSYEEKEIAFEDAVEEQTDYKFNPEFGARCYDFSSIEKADKFLQKKFKQAKKRNFQILWINFATSE